MEPDLSHTAMLSDVYTDAIRVSLIMFACMYIFIMLRVNLLSKLMLLFIIYSSCNLMNAVNLFEMLIYSQFLQLLCLIKIVMASLSSSLFIDNNSKPTLSITCPK